MPDHCDPYVYFTRVRPYIHGWKDNPARGGGVVYGGVSGNAPQLFRGQTGSQSSIVPTMDALLGVGHENDPLKAYLDELHLWVLRAQFFYRFANPLADRNLAGALGALHGE